MKYTIDSSEAAFEPGSGGRVLRNKVSINNVVEMNEAEELLLLKLYDLIFGNTFEITSLSFNDIIDWHRKWLGSLYDWAGKLRSVDMSILLVWLGIR